MKPASLPGLPRAMNRRVTGPRSTGLRIFAYVSIFLLGLQALDVSLPPSPLVNLFAYFCISLAMPGELLAHWISRNLSASDAILVGALAPFLAALCWALLGSGIHKAMR